MANMNLTEKKEMKMKHYFSCYQGMIKQGKLYAVASTCKAICCVDFGQRKAEVIRWLDESSAMPHKEYLSVCRMDDSIVLVPAGSDSVGLYDYKKNILTYINLKQAKLKKHESYNQNIKFFGGFSSHDNIYLLGASYPAILKLNADSGQVSYLDEWVEKFQETISETDGSFYFAHSYLIDGEMAYIPGRGSGTMLGLNLLTDQTTVYSMHVGVKMLHGIVRSGNKIWVLASMDDRESLFSWSPEKGFMDEIIIVKNPSEDFYWWKPVESGGYLYLFQMNGNMVYKVSVQKKMIEPCEEVINAIGYIPKGAIRYSVRLMGEEEGKIFFMSSWKRTPKWYIYHTKDRSIESFQIEISNAEYDYRYRNELKRKSYIKEQELSLKEFLRVLREGKVF